MASVLTIQRPAHVGAAPPARGGHTASQVGNLMVVFGGQYYYRGKFFYLDDVWALDVDAVPQKWHKAQCGGTGKPGPRYCHAAAVVGYSIYIFGGKGENGIIYNDLWKLNVEDWTWELLPSVTAPPSLRFGHTLTAIGERLICFGGWDGKECVDNGLWLYDPSTLSWVRPRCNGIAPTARQGHSTVFDGSSGRLVIVGGTSYDKERLPQPMNDVREIDLRTMTWSRPPTKGDVPTPRYWMANTLLANCLVLYGGWRGSEEFTGAPLLPAGEKADGVIDIPHKPGMGYGSVAEPGTMINVPYAVHPDFYLYDLDAREFVRPKLAGKQPGYRWGSTVVTHGLHVISFGGWEDGKAVAEVLVMDLSSLAQPADEQPAA